MPLERSNDIMFEAGAKLRIIYLRSIGTCLTLAFKVRGGRYYVAAQRYGVLSYVLFERSSYANAARTFFNTATERYERVKGPAYYLGRWPFHELTGDETPGFIFELPVEVDASYVGDAENIQR